MQRFNQDDSRSLDWPPANLDAFVINAMSSVSGRLLGIDAGGSSTKVVALEAGRVTKWPDGAPMNALLTENLVELLYGLICRTGATAVGIGMPGVPTVAEAGKLGEALTALAGCPVRVVGDAQVARLGAFLGGPGVVVIAGTGSAALGSDEERSARAGGHGFLLGDEGGAYWIGREAVRAALRWEDQMGGSERIHRTVTQAIGTDLGALVSQVHYRPAERHRLARLAPAVTALAAEDADASRIAERAARHLAALAEAVRRRVGPLPVAGVGGVFQAPVIWDRFAKLTGATRPLAAPAVGAAVLAGMPESQGHG